ncbi:hypothetical protein V495_00716 [Pseudogymnoascus sp. VKM F-4514 (FW-929)]|nr:hypothetical protein V495_00716 [Pseudogymnoascus sp. VKM F-4514 (FW-929)]KFY65789.1 hypothetical protein V497_01293 [Pseudogymnoascus sp. VKM F-4516 (FW-969)]
MNRPRRPLLSRSRAAHACDVCRRKKIRCNGGQPCATCLSSGHECIYGAEAGPKGKSDLILDGVLRMERHLEEMSAIIASNVGVLGHRVLTDPAISPEVTHSHDIAERSSHHHSQSATGNDAQGVHNAVLSSLHTSTTESVLDWPHFDIFPSIGQNYTPIFQLEKSRPPLTTMTSAAVPYLRADEVQQVIEAFQSSINFFYPTMLKDKLVAVQNLVLSGNLDDSVSSCISLLVMALGCASQVVSLLFNTSALTSQSLEYQISQRRLAEVYFDGVLKRLHTTQLEISTESTQCLFFVALYFAYLQRPLQAWSYINTTAARCRLLLSDYLAELAALPASGIASIESTIPLPGQYNTHTITNKFTPATPLSPPSLLPPTVPRSEDQELSSLYFLACISMRRLLNRVHDMLYAPTTGVSPSPSRFPTVVSELSHQLDEWRDLLPEPFKFSLDTEPTQTQHGGFLRQRYLTCRSVIYRPYLTWVLENWNNGASWENGGYEHDWRDVDLDCIMPDSEPTGPSKRRVINAWEPPKGSISAVEQSAWGE